MSWAKAHVVLMVAAACGGCGHTLASDHAPLMVTETLPPAMVGRMSGVVALHGVSDDYIENAVVQAFRDPKASPVAEARTDAKGRFRLRLGPGVYIVRVIKEGFRESELTVTNSGSGAPDLAISMYLGI
jgi:hypothetical protein